MRRTQCRRALRQAYDSEHHDGMYRNGAGEGQRGDGKLGQHGGQSVRRAIMRMSTHVARGPDQGVGPGSGQGRGSGE